MTGERVVRRLAAILAADVVGYSRLMGRDENGTLARLKAHRTERLEPVLARHGGRLVKLTGDGALVEFPSAVDALSSAIEFQLAMAEANRDQPQDNAIVFRIGQQTMLAVPMCEFPQISPANGWIIALSLQVAAQATAVRPTSINQWGRIDARTSHHAVLRHHRSNITGQ